MPRAARSKPKAKNEQKPTKEETIKRERSLRACTRCRQRKQKCDNALPNCSNCVKGGVPCEAFPIDIASRENLVQLYDQLQESMRRNVAMQEELDAVRLIAPDTLGVVSALILRKVSSPTLPGDDSRTSPDMMASQPNSMPSNMPPGHTQVQLYLPPTMASVKHQPEDPTASTSKMSLPKAADPVDLWKIIELLERCFPAVAPAISFVVEHLDPKVKSGRWCNLVGIADNPIRELVTLLGGATAFEASGSSEGQPTETERPPKELTNKILTANEVTRVAASFLWALLALVKHRTEELLRMDTVLTCFMQGWQTQGSSDPSTSLSVIPISFRRAYDWIHLHSAVMTGKLHVQATLTNSVEGVEALANNTDLATFIASFSVEQKRLEYVALHLFTSPFGAMSDVRHEEAVWQLLRSIKELSDVFSQTSDTFGVSANATVNAQRVLMRQKMGLQLYGMFPRMLFVHCPNDRRHWRWLANAAPLAVTALSCHHAAWVQSGWAGDHIFDAVAFADLLAAFVWTLQQRKIRNDLHQDWSEAVETAIELGERFASKWTQCSSIIEMAVQQLKSFREEQSSALNTPWPSVSSHTTSSPGHSELRTPAAGESMNNCSLPPLDLQAEWQDVQQQQQQQRCWSGADCSTATEGQLYSAGTFQRADGMGLYSPPMNNFHCWLAAEQPNLIPQRSASASASTVTRAAHQPSRILLYLDDQTNPQL